MPRFIHALCGSVAAAIWLWAMTPSAFAQSAASTNAGLSVDQTRAAFASAGYLVGEAHTWDWMLHPFTAFRVSDPASGRVVTVVVYANIAAADQARLQAAHGQIQNASSTDGPSLVTGFGSSFWSGNVALVQSTESELQQLYQLQQARDMSVNDDDGAGHERPLDTVGVDFARVLYAGTVNL